MCAACTAVDSSIFAQRQRVVPGLISGKGFNCIAADSVLFHGLQAAPLLINERVDESEQDWICLSYDSSPKH